MPSWFCLATLSLLVACTPRSNDAVAPEPAPTAAPIPSASHAPVAEPATAPIWPPPAPPLSTQKGECPMHIVPGQSLGPIAIGQRTDTLSASGLAVTKRSQNGPAAVFSVGSYGVRTCADAVVEIWIEDLRKAPDCVRATEKIARNIKREALIASYQDCHAGPPSTGGTSVACERGGVRIGYGMGDFLQVRVGRTGSTFNEQCEDLLDDGHAVTLPPAELTPLLKQTLDLSELAQFWHPEKPNRDPLRIVKHAALGDPPKLKMFGSNVVWIDASAKSDGLPYFELTSIKATARRVIIEFRFEVEGVRGYAEFAKRGDTWALDKHSAVER